MGPNTEITVQHKAVDRSAAFADHGNTSIAPAPPSLCDSAPSPLGISGKGPRAWADAAAFKAPTTGGVHPLCVVQTNVGQRNVPKDQLAVARDAEPLLAAQAQRVAGGEALAVGRHRAVGPSAGGSRAFRAGRPARTAAPPGRPRWPEISGMLQAGSPLAVA